MENRKDDACREQFEFALQKGGGFISKLIRQWCDAAGQELVRVSTRQKGNREATILHASRMAIYVRRDDAHNFIAHDINDKPRTEDLDQFDS